MTAVNERPVETGTAFRVEREGNVAVVVFDLPNEPVNKFNRAVTDEFADILARLEGDSSLSGAVLISGKSDIFIAGADIDQFLDFRQASDAESASREGQRLLDRVEESRLPFVAAINGACLGGGLEMALACHYRVGTDHRKTVLALPEVQLGVIPGLGGTQRLPRTVGLRNALDMILTGKNVRAKKALQTGLLDEMVHPSILRDLAVSRARELGEGTRKRSRGRKEHGATDMMLEDNPVGRSVVFRKARDGVLAKTHGHYPAPLAALDAVRAGYDHGMVRGLEEEARIFGQMAVTEVSKQLVFLFFATTALKKDTGVEREVEMRKVRKLAVLGAGFMGAGIAAVTAQQAIPVRLKDAAHDRVGKGLKAVSDVLRERLKRKQITRREYEDMMALVSGTVDYSGFGNVDIVVEAVFEEIGLKHRVLRETEAVIPRDAIYASNTSTIPITRIAEASDNPPRVVGIHFFSPVHKMPLVEVIRAEQTSDEAVATAVGYGKKLGKTVIVVNDSPGFYVNRILSPYINEAGKLLDEGVAIDALDNALTDFGFPVGPITLVDEVGLDVAGKSGQVMFEALGPRMAPPESIRRVIEAGRLGRKGRKGFYRYGDDGKKGGVDETIYDLLPTAHRRIDMPPRVMQQRCVLAMLNEAARCLEEGVLRSTRDGDVGAVFGIGFPPFRGGPFRYMDTLGVMNVVEQLQALHAKYAPRFEPAGILVRMAAEEARFYE